jgi:ABC-type transporter Mla subunit MlaD
MYTDLVNKALDQAKSIQKTVGEAITKSAEQAQPLIGEAVAKANVLRETLVHTASSATEGAKPHLDGALGHLNTFIAQGKGALETTVAKAQDQLEPLAEHVRKTIEATTAAIGRKADDAAKSADAAATESAPK